MTRIRVHVRSRPDRRNLQLAYTCPITGQVHTRSAGTTDTRAAERAAAKWEAEILAGQDSQRCTWVYFRDRFEIEFLDRATPNTRSTFVSSLNHFENHVGRVRDLGSITGSVLSRFAASLQSADLAPATVAKILRHVRSALAWARGIGLIDRVPQFRIPKTPKRRLARGRPVTDAEFARFVAAVPKVIDQGLATEWQEFLRFLWLSGLRISEALRVSWDQPPVTIDLSGRRPKIRWLAEGQKNRSDDVTPIPPDLADWLAARQNKTGPVFDLRNRHPLKGEIRISPRWASRKIAEIGRQSGVMVSETKHVSAHDLRRTFGNRWALRVHPVVLRKMMRHSTMETTMGFYVDLDADTVADELWDQVGNTGKSTGENAGKK